MFDIKPGMIIWLSHLKLLAELFNTQRDGTAWDICEMAPHVAGYA